MPLSAIGNFKERVTLQQSVATDDGSGGRVIDWDHPTHQTKTWASVEPLSLNEREKLNAMQITAIAAYRVRMRYRPEVRPGTWRVLWRERTLEIQTVQDTDGSISMHSQQRRTVLECTELQ
jgi:SPP1 family predicted phage head-tail adaptor